MRSEIALISENTIEETLVGRNLRQAHAAPSNRNATMVSECEPTNKHTNESTNEHNGSQYLLAEVAI